MSEEVEIIETGIVFAVKVEVEAKVKKLQCMAIQHQNTNFSVLQV